MSLRKLDFNSDADGHCHNFDGGCGFGEICLYNSYIESHWDGIKQLTCVDRNRWMKYNLDSYNIKSG